MAKEAMTLAGIAAFLAAVACAIVAVTERERHSPSALLQLPETPPWTVEKIAFPGEQNGHLFPGEQAGELFPGDMDSPHYKYTPVYNRNFYAANDPTGAVAGYMKTGIVTSWDDMVPIKEKGYSRNNVYIDKRTLEKGEGPAFIKIGDIPGEAYDEKNMAVFIKYDGLQPEGTEYNPKAQPYPGAGSYFKMPEVKPVEGDGFLKIGDIKGESYKGEFIKIGDIKGEPQ